MKATIEFSLPEEDYEFRCAYSASSLALTAYDLDNYLRDKIKYQSDNLSDETVEEIQAVRTELTEIIEYRNLGFLFD